MLHQPIKIYRGVDMTMLSDIKKIVSKKKDISKPDKLISIPLKYVEHLLSIVEDKELKDLDTSFCDCCLGGIHNKTDKIFYI
jgi:hypothetical protein